jgi:hypothetical protein
MNSLVTIIRNQKKSATFGIVQVEQERWKGQEARLGQIQDSQRNLLSALMILNFFTNLILLFGKKSNNGV